MRNWEEGEERVSGQREARGCSTHLVVPLKCFQPCKRSESGWGEREKVHQLLPSSTSHDGQGEP